MTPIEAAVKVGRKRFDGEVEGMSAYAAFGAGDARAIITAFLEAAAGDGDMLRAIRVSGVPEGRLGIFERDISGIILALKEAVG